MLSLPKNKAFRTVFGSSFTRAYLLLVELALVAISAGLLPPRERGVYVAAIGLLKTMSVLSTLSLGQIAVHRIASAGGQRTKELGRQAGNLLVGGVLVSLIAVAAFHVVGMVSPAFHATYVSPFQWVVIVGLPIYLFELYFYTLLTASDELNAANVSILVGKTAAWLLPVVSGYFFSMISVFLLILYVVLGQLLVVLGYVWSLKKMSADGKIRVSFAIGTFVSAAKSAMRLYPTVVGSVVFGGIDLLLIYNYSGAAEASAYQIALQGIAALSVLPFAIAQYGYTTVAKHGTLDGWQRYRKVLYAGLTLHVVLAALSILVVQFGAPLLEEHGYSSLPSIYYLLALGSPGVYLSLTMAPMWIGSGFFLLSSSLSLVTAGIALPLTSVLVKTHGLVGGGYAFLFAQILSLITNGLLIYYNERNGKK